jgi:hypothetical protein
MKRIASLALVAALASSSAGCLGSYSATKKLNQWNFKATGTPVVNSVIHFGLWVIPVYELAILGDFLIFNNVEFFTNKPVF